MITRREVWTKETKGRTAVRKLVVWQTRKESVAAGWPAWVVHFTDYSPDRKTPLERTVKLARSAADANAIAASLITENIKKGWEPASTPRVASPAEAAAPDEAAAPAEATAPAEAAAPAAPSSDAASAKKSAKSRASTSKKAAAASDEEPEKPAKKRAAKAEDGD